MFNSEIDVMAKDQILEYISETETSIGLTQKDDAFFPLIHSFRQFFQADQLVNGLPSTIDIEKVTDEKRRRIQQFADVYARVQVLDLAVEPSIDVNGNEITIGGRIGRIIESIDDYYEVVFRYLRTYERINFPNLVPIATDVDGSFFRVKTLDGVEDEKSANQKLLLYFLNELKRNNMKRYKGQCYQQIMFEGVPTRAWIGSMEIEEFIYRNAQKETKYDMWKNLTGRSGTVSECLKYLSKSVDVQFPEIVKNRSAWSFRNGILDQGTFIEYPKVSEPIVTSKFFDKTFDDFQGDWWDIPTPHFQSILDYQHFDEDVSKWLYVFGGRLCFDVNVKDRWQVIPFLKGVARSGKSTILTKVFKKFYDHDDVRTLSNNIEKKFGLWSIHDGFMFICPEVKGDLSLEQAEFQSIVSGEDVSIARKNEKALSKEWTVPGIMAGNEVPGYRDNSGSIMRRLVTWDFKKQVTDADPTLEDRLDDELPKILLKCVRAYLEYSQKYQNKDIWNVLPGYFKKVQDQIALVTNTLLNFLASERLRFGPDLCMPQKAFVSAFKQHCVDNNLPMMKYNADACVGPFSTKDLEVVTRTMDYQGVFYTDTLFIKGVDMVSAPVVTAPTHDW